MISITSLQEYLQSEKVFGEKKSLTLMGLPGSGINTVLKDFAFLPEHINYIYIDLKNIGKVSEYNAMKHIARSIVLSLSTRLGIKIKEQSVNYENFYSTLDSLLSILVELKNDNDLVIVFDNFQYISKLETYFFESLRRLKELKGASDQILFSFIFSSDSYLHPEELINRLGDLYEYVYTNVEYVNGFSVEEITDVLQPITKKNRELSKRILRWSAGNPKLVDSILDWLGKRLEIDPELSQIDDYEDVISRDLLVMSFLKKIWSSLTDKQKQVLLGESVLEKWEFEYKYLLGTRLIVNIREGGVETSLGLVDSSSFSVSNTAKNESLPVPPVKKEESPKEQFVKPGEIDTDMLSAQEYKVFDLLKRNKGNIVSKGDISKVIWGTKKSGRKKAWAIDQLMKRVRSKVGDDNNELIQTVRGRGYRYQA